MLELRADGKPSKQRVTMSDLREESDGRPSPQRASTTLQRDMVKGQDDSSEDEHVYKSSDGADSMRAHAQSMADADAEREDRKMIRLQKLRINAVFKNAKEAKQQVCGAVFIGASRQNAATLSAPRSLV